MCGVFWDAVDGARWMVKWDLNVDDGIEVG